MKPLEKAAIRTYIRGLPAAIAREVRSAKPITFETAYQEALEMENDGNDYSAQGSNGSNDYSRRKIIQPNNYGNSFNNDRRAINLVRTVRSRNLPSDRDRQDQQVCRQSNEELFQ